MTGVLIDSYLKDSNHQVEEFPNSSRIIRNYGKVLVENGQINEGMGYERKAILIEEPDDVAASWLGNDLHNWDRFRDAAEIYTIACVIDPDDVNYFVHLADELTICLKKFYSTIFNSDNAEMDSKDIVPEPLLLKIFACCISFKPLSTSVYARLDNSAKRVEIDIKNNPNIYPLLPLSGQDRKQIALDVHELLKTELTDFKNDYQFNLAQQVT